MDDLSEPPVDGPGSTPTGAPEWIPPPSPWAAESRSPWNGGGSGPWPPTSSTAPWALPSPASGPKGSRSSIAAVAVTALVAALIGAGAGALFHGRRSAANPVAASQLIPAPATTAPTTPVTLAPATPSTDPAATTPTTPAPGGTPSTSVPSGQGSVTAQASAIAAKVEPGIVDVNTRLGYQNGAGAGTGMILTSSGRVLTNNHVVEGATAISVTLVSSGRTYTAHVVGTDPTDDIAVIQLQNATGLVPIPIGDSSAVKPGDPVVALGNALGAGGAPSVVTGTVQALDQTITASDQNGANAEQLSGLIQFDAPIQPGDSGGPLVSAAAQVIGMDTAASAGRRFNSAPTAAFAIPIAHALSIVQQISSGQATATIHIGLPGILGVSVRPATTSAGALIAQVQTGSPAETAGMTAGDVITSFNGQPVGSADALTALTKNHHPGDRVTVGWTDQAGASHSASVILAPGPPD